MEGRVGRIGRSRVRCIEGTWLNRVAQLQRVRLVALPRNVDGLVAAAVALGVGAAAVSDFSRAGTFMRTAGCDVDGEGAVVVDD